MNERDFSQTHTEATKRTLYEDVEFKQLRGDGDNQRPLEMFLLPGKKYMGILTAEGVQTTPNGEEESVYEITYKDDNGEIRVARGLKKDVLAYHTSEKEHRGRITKNVAGPVLRSEVVVDSEDETGVNKDGVITGMPKDLQPVDYVKSEATDGNTSRRVPVAMPPDPHGAIGFLNRKDYFKELGRKPDSHN